MLKLSNVGFGEAVNKEEQISQISGKLNVPKLTVTAVWDAYIDLLKSRLKSGESVKFLNVCYLRYGSELVKPQETLAYISTELARVLNLERNIVHRILTCYEEFLVSDLRKFYDYRVRGLVRIRLEKIRTGSYSVRLRKSTVYNDKDIRVITLNSFKRKVLA